ncbi:type I restriction-modification system specificity protein [Leptospira ryugenii]|uniref:Type I restriction-modification system specificity protein n=1 Tax=Leptospira ryugenii TaxID=1917863 RepID=A0A2P2DXR3_9LEPT|nr:restriction endonuclease subunit S [Leptospira ryugenii]GBF49425.1 type I restriction-modification system specificity protein [Leptospira ryugenii]
MAIEWKTYKLGRDAVTKLGDGLHGTPIYDTKGGYFFINGSNLVERKIVIDSKTKRVNEKEFDKYKKDLSERTILLGINGTIGNVAIYNNEKCILGKSAAYFNINEYFDKNFIFYLFISDHFQNYIKNNATGTTIKNVGLGLLRDYEFSAPPLPTQKAIAHILGTLDDKIELLRQMNETLEAMARAIFQSWFVDFDPVRKKADGLPTGLPKEIEDLFPSEFEDSELGEIPKGWKVGKLGDVASIRKEAITPMKKPEEIFKHYSLPSYDEGKNAKLESGNTILSNKYLVRINDILLSKLNPRIKRIWFIKEDILNSICSTEFLVFTSKIKTQHSFLFSLLNEDSFYEKIEGLVNGTSGSHQRVKSEDVLNLNILIPNIHLSQTYENLASPLFKKQNENLLEIQTLSSFRDILLPKLISGELELSDDSISKILESAK